MAALHFVQLLSTFRVAPGCGFLRLRLSSWVPKLLQSDYHQDSRRRASERGVNDAQGNAYSNAPKGSWHDDQGASNERGGSRR